MKHPTLSQARGHLGLIYMAIMRLRSILRESYGKDPETMKVVELLSPWLFEEKRASGTLRILQELIEEDRPMSTLDYRNILHIVDITTILRFYLNIHSPSVPDYRDLPILAEWPTK